MNSIQASPFTQLPDPIVAQIFSYLPVDEAVFNSSRVCRRFWLLQKNIIEQLEINGSTPLHHAAQANSVKKIEFLVARGANLELYNIEKQTPLLLTFLNKQWRTFRLLVALGANINVFDKNGDAPIHLSIRQRCDDSFRMAILSHANLNLKNVHGKTPLHVATNENQIGVVKRLLELGADPEISDNRIIKPLDAAAMSRFQPIIETFLASPWYVDENLLSDETLQRITRVIEYRLVEGYICDSTYASGKTHLQWSIIGKNHDLTRKLLHKNVNPNTPDSKGFCPLHYAAQIGESESIEALIDARCEINATLPDGRTALHLAIQSGKFLAANLLIEKGADIEAADTKKQTPLHYVAIHYSKPFEQELVMLAKNLIRRGAKPNLQDIHLKTPADYIVDAPKLSYQLQPSSCELM